MTDIKALLERYDEWDEDTAIISAREDEAGYAVTASLREDSNDEGVELAHLLATALRAKRTVWSLTVINWELKLALVSLHNSEDEAIESLEVTHGDDVEHDTDSVLHDLENRGYVIHIDSHEI